MTIDELLQPGTRLRIRFDDSSPDHTALEVRAVVDEDYVVVRQWSEEKEDWLYRIEYRVYFEMLLAHGNVSKED